MPSFRASIENSSDVISLVSAAGEVLYASASSAKVFGYLPEELVGRNAFDLMHPEDREHLRWALQEVLASPPGPRQLEARVRHENGQWRWVESTIYNLLDEPHVAAIVVNCREISPRKAASEHNQLNAVSTRVGICDTQPVGAEGLGILLNTCPDLKFAGMADTLTKGRRLAESGAADILIVDTSFGMQDVIAWITNIRCFGAATSQAGPPAIVAWGESMAAAEILCLLQAGALGIIPKSADLSRLVTCLRTVANNHRWIEDLNFIGPKSRFLSQLTAREQQVVELLEKGLKNKEIAARLGIRTHTVKIHLTHIFAKKGVHTRHSLAVTSLKEKEAGSLGYYV